MRRHPKMASSSSQQQQQQQQPSHRPVKTKSEPMNMLSVMVGSTSKPVVGGLPPKSPSSVVTGRLLQQSSQRRRSSSKKRSSSRRRRGSRRSSSPEDSPTSSGSDSSLSPDQQQRATARQQQQTPHLLSHEMGGLSLTQNRSLLDPSPEHMNVAGNSDDFCSTPDLSNVTFESACSSSVASSCVVLEQPSSAPLWNSMNGVAPSTGQRQHRRGNSWDSNEGYEGANPKPCLPFFRRQKVMSADVASVGNASDTLVVMVSGDASTSTTSNAANRISGRDLHEKAKAVLNAGNYEDAILMFEALQKAQMERFGSEWHASVGAATHNVAVVRLRMGHAKQAEELFEQAVAIRRKVLGDEHLDLAASLAKLGSARVALQKFDDGLVVLREALQISQKTLGRSNKTVAQILCHIACLYFEASELFSAQATFEDALEIYRSFFPNANDRDACMAQMTDTLCNIGSIQNKRKNFMGAIDCFREALDLQRGIMGHDHPRVIATLDNLGYSFSKAKMHHQAVACYKEMMTAQLSRLGGFTEECCETLKKQILLYEKMKDVNGAIQAAKSAMDRVLADTPIPESAVTFEIEQILTDLMQKRNNKRRSEI